MILQRIRKKRFDWLIYFFYFLFFFDELVVFLDFELGFGIEVERYDVCWMKWNGNNVSVGCFGWICGFFKEIGLQSCVV